MRHVTIIPSVSDLDKIMLVRSVIRGTVAGPYCWSGSGIESESTAAIMAHGTVQGTVSQQEKAEGRIHDGTICFGGVAVSRCSVCSNGPAYLHTGGFAR
jgi:hypothetical protein